MNELKTKNYFEYFFLSIIFLYALHLCFVNNYGWDWDTYAMLETFIKIKEEGYYIRSRGAGYLLPEIGIGFLSFYLGSLAVNLLTFSFLIVGLIFLFLAFENLKFKKEELNKKIFLFIILCLTNHVVIRDSTIPMDYSWSFMFYSIALYSLINNKTEWSILFFALCFGSRFNFIAFIIPTIMFLDKRILKFELKLLHLAIITFFGCLFYVPSWLNNEFSLSFIYSEQAGFKTNSIFSFEEIARFSFKLLKTFGIFSFIYIFYLLFRKRKKLIKEKFLLIIIFFNFLVFFIFPWEPSFLWLSIFTIFFIIVINFNYKVVYFLIFLNIFNWFYQAEIVKIFYNNDDGCIRNPINAEFQPHFSKGIVLAINERFKATSCYPELLSRNKEILIMKYKNEIKSGKKLKN